MTNATATAAAPEQGPRSFADVEAAFRATEDGDTFMALYRSGSEGILRSLELGLFDSALNDGLEGAEEMSGLEGHALRGWILGWFESSTESPGSGLLAAGTNGREKAYQGVKDLARQLTSDRPLTKCLAALFLTWHLEDVTKEEPGDLGAALDTALAALLAKLKDIDPDHDYLKMAAS